jgi:PhzF family phenazine biosynthesis protein
MKLHQIDAFAAGPFSGNPAAVCLLTDTPVEAWLQQVAREMNLSETAFLRRSRDGFQLRWFTPEVEVDLCGHATLASAHFLWEEGELQADEQARFHTRSGLLTAQLRQGWIEMDFPAEPPEEIRPSTALLAALGTTARYVGRNRFDFLVELDSQRAVEALTPDFMALREASQRGVIVTSASADRRFDFVSRFFAPAVGINEDPVTGSAHCCLAPFWSQRLGRQELVGFQASARGGIVKTRHRGERVSLAGQAVTVLRGELLV